MTFRLWIIAAAFFTTSLVHAGKTPVLKPAPAKKPSKVKTQLLEMFSENYKAKKDLVALKKKALNLGGKAVPALIEVMKNGKYPDKNRWMATFLLGKIMGKKASPFVSKFLKHPHWIMRMASLKTLLALKDVRYGREFAMSLKDNSYIVRIQALDNIRTLGLTHLGPQVWAMLYDKKNYHSDKKGATKRTNIIKKVITTIGDLKFERAKGPLLKMAQNKKYEDIFPEIDYSLEKITGKDSPEGKAAVKRHYWSRILLAESNI